MVEKTFKFLALGIFALIVLYVIFSNSETSGQGVKFFDHSSCQYPSRTTNPLNGCDNTDPCDAAAAAKGGSGDCVVDSTTNTDLSMSQNTFMEGK